MSDEPTGNEQAAREAPEEAAPRPRVRREVVLVAAGVVVALAAGVVLSGVVTSGGPPADAGEEAAPPEPVVPRQLEPEEVLDAFQGVMAEGRYEHAKSLLEAGLSRVDPDDVVLRARFFNHLAEVSAKLDLPNAARVYRANGERLSRRSQEVMLLFSEGCRALAGGHYATGRRLLYAVLLRQNELGTARESLVPEVHRRIAEAWYGEFTDLAGDELAVEDPPLLFEGTP